MNHLKILYINRKGPQKSDSKSNIISNIKFKCVNKKQILNIQKLYSRLNKNFKIMPQFWTSKVR